MSDDNIERQKKIVERAKEEFRELDHSDLLALRHIMNAGEEKWRERFESLRNQLENQDDLTDEQREFLDEQREALYWKWYRMHVRLDVAEKEFERRAVGKETMTDDPVKRELLRDVAENHTEGLRAVVQYLERDSRPKHAWPKEKTELFRSVFEEEKNYDQLFSNWWERNGLDYPSTVWGLYEACREALELKEAFPVDSTADSTSEPLGTEGRDAP